MATYSNIFDHFRRNKVIKLCFGPKENSIEFDENRTLRAFFEEIYHRNFMALGIDFNEVLAHAKIRSRPPRFTTR